ncbi:MAG TPA: CehA/McbA family metallohydrolase [Terracidiphilus sp.]|nr:CehA/McbA family metallohydrolase [Terracidiphilus sp.]
MPQRFFRPGTTIACAALLLLLLPIAAVAMGQQQTSAAASASVPDLVLEGVVTSSQNETYIQVPFDVPSGTERVTLTFDYTGKKQHTALDLGLLDPVELRCWSGGNKSLLTVGTADATPSCLPGLIPAGKWNVLIGVPNIRPNVQSHYTIHVYFSSTGAVAGEPTILNAPLKAGPAWYRGDLHMHTAQSDGQCPSQTGKMVPCPVYFSVDAAARRGLDFIAITDHNASSQYNPMRELQPYFDKVLLIPGREITTFQGHINFLGTTDFVDFRLGSKEVPDVNSLLRSAASVGGLTSINHPGDPSGEICLGCGWTPASPVDMHLLTAVEAVNGGSEQYGIPNIPFWNKQLNAGCRLTGIGGSDNHRPMQPLDGIGSIGSPTTVVYATELSTPAILAGIRAGHVFIDLAGTRDRLLEVTARTGDKVVHMGDLLAAPEGQTVDFDVHVAATAGGTVRWLEDGQEVALKTGAAVTSADQSFSFAWVSDGRRHWFRAEVTGADGKMWLLGNPIYVNWEIANSCNNH